MFEGLLKNKFLKELPTLFHTRFFSESTQQSNAFYLTL